MQDNTRKETKFYRYTIRGIVQGVGFRPYIHRIAETHNLKGTIKNTSSGVEIITDDSDLKDKLTNIPPLAKIIDIRHEPHNPKQPYKEFKIIPSKKQKGTTIIPPDTGICEDCQRELDDKNDRRHNYYFTTCTNCGPRFTTITDTPYDRHTTSMKEFEMCEACKKEYTDPTNRRFHAETIACKNCGPELILKENNNKTLTKENESDEETIKKAAQLLKNNQIIAIKGIGGYHLCSNAKKETTQKLRTIINRKNQPLAIMVKDIEEAKMLAAITKQEEQLLLSKEKPIITLKKHNIHEHTHISELDTIGIMLPYTALHHILFQHISEPLIMTSMNSPGSPTEITDENTNRFTSYALTNPRKITNRCDDSVIKIINNTQFYLRRSRGYAPVPIPLPISTQDTIALGAEQSNTISITKDNLCFISQHIGNTRNLNTHQFQKETIQKFIQLTNANPKIIACDLNPGYNSTQYAKELKKRYNAELIQIQHHKAHIAGVAAEHNLKDYIGIAIDGNGYGEDNTIWGGEIFKVTNHTEFERIAHLEQQPQLGGDSATMNPKKMLLGILTKFLNEKEIHSLNIFEKKETSIYLNQLEQKFNTPLTSSAGRILDAASALLNICTERTYEGRPAMLLESNSTTPYDDIKPTIKKQDNRSILKTTPLFEYMMTNIDKDKTRLAATAQQYLAEGLLKIAKEHSKNNNTRIVVSGGVAYNRIITTYLKENSVLTNKEIPAGDGGISYGQAYLANLIKISSQ